MSLEAKIESLTTALNDNTAALKAAMASGAVPGKSDAPAGDKKGPGRPPKAKGPTKEEVTAAAKAYATAHGKPAAKALISKHGGADLASIPEANWQAFVDATKEEPEAEGDDDDGL